LIRDAEETSMGMEGRAVERRLHYGWIVAGLTFVTLLAAAGVRSVPAVLMVPLEQEFGWQRSTISFAISLNLLLYGFMGPFSAAIADRLGPRRMMMVAMACLGLGVCLTLVMTASWQLVILWGIVIGCGAGMVALALGAFIVNRWFVERRGIVMGGITAATAMGQLLFLPSLAAIIEADGWRVAATAVAVLVFLTVPMLWFFMRDFPAEVGQRPFGSRNDAPPPRPATGNPFTTAFAALGHAVASRDFWLLSMSFFICGLSTNGLIGTHLIAACIDHGIPQVMAASLLAMMGVCNLIGTIGSGWLSDRYNNRYLLCAYYALRGVSLLFLPVALNTTTIDLGLTVFAIFYGLDWISTVPPTLRLTTDIFKGNGALVYGWIVAIHQVGSAVAAFLGGVSRTYLGDYFDAFIVSGIACFIAAILVLRVGQATRNHRAAEAVPSTAAAE
jgi:MFS family permease